MIQTTIMMTYLLCALIVAAWLGLGFVAVRCFAQLLVPKADEQQAYDEEEEAWYAQVQASLIEEAEQLAAELLQQT